MSAAILQGVPVMTLDIDLWVDLPSRQYMSVLNLCRSLGASVIRNTVVSLSDGTMVNFTYHVDGLRSFESELRHAKRLLWMGMRLPVLPLERILVSKRAIMREKDVAHIPLLRYAIVAKRRLSRR